MWIVSERHDGNTSKTPFKESEKDKAQKLVDKINDAGGVAILIEVGIKTRIKREAIALENLGKACRASGISAGSIK